uniref:Uncharacterized protein ORF33 n=1 Tax=Metapseudomonas resinovorans TaxID=53412 RepID=Q9AQM2_METRE|nr:hypothetical protein [Pseudomonas resinovorans]
MDEKTEFAWDDSYLLGHHAMDMVHREFVDLLQAALTAPNAELPNVLADIARHAEGHFAQENEWMESQGFPGGDCHIDEHNKVLASIYDVQEKVIQGDIAIGRKPGESPVRVVPRPCVFYGFCSRSVASKTYVRWLADCSTTCNSKILKCASCSRKNYFESRKFIL